MAEVEEVEVAAEAPASPAYEFDDAFQHKIAALTLRDPQFMPRTDGLIMPEYFVNVGDQTLISLSREFYAKYKKAPDMVTLAQIIKDRVKEKKLRKDVIPELRARLSKAMKADLTDREFVTEKVVEFARERAIENALMASVDLHEKKKYSDILKLFQTAVSVGVGNAVGADFEYFATVASRTERRIAEEMGLIKPRGITTGIVELDNLLYHKGWGRKEVSCLMAPAKFGKSMGLGDFAKYASFAGFTVLILSLENSREIYSDRMDANVADTLMTELRKKPLEVRKKVEEISAKAAPIYIHDFASGTLKASGIRRLIEQYRQKGVIFDLIVIDYGDIMAPEVKSGDKLVDSESIWIDIRAIAYDEDAAVLTATQTNRDGAKAHAAKGTDISADFKKVMHVDLLMVGAATEEEIESGVARLILEANRNQKGETLLIQQDRARMKFLKKILKVGRI